MIPDILFFFFNLLLFIYLFLARLGLHGCEGLFSSCSARASRCGGFSVAAHGL